MRAKPISAPTPAPAGAAPPVSPAVRGGARCAVHPVRRAVDTCPVCARPRCAADAADSGDRGCSVCRRDPTTAVAGTSHDATDVERYVRAALASTAVALLGGVVAAQYVEAAVFSYLTPFVVGVLTAAGAQKAFGRAGSASAVMRIRVLAGAYAVLGVAFGFVLERSVGVTASSSVLPYLAAVGGVVLWTLPPKRR